VLRVSGIETGSSNPEGEVPEVEVQTASEIHMTPESDITLGTNVGALGAPTTSQRSYKEVVCGVKQ
jgi:hypothetical protein